MEGTASEIETRAIALSALKLSTLTLSKLVEARKLEETDLIQLLHRARAYVAKDPNRSVAERAAAIIVQLLTRNPPTPLD